MHTLRQSSCHKNHAQRREVLLGMQGENIASPYQESAISEQNERPNGIQENLGSNKQLSNMESAALVQLKLSSNFEPIFELKLPAVPSWRRRFPLERLPFDIKCQLLCSLGHLSTLKLLLIASAYFHQVSQLIRTRLLNVYKDDITGCRYPCFGIWSVYHPPRPRSRA